MRVERGRTGWAARRAADFARLLAHSRVALAALAVGVMRGALDYAIEYAKEREQFGAPIATRQAIAFMLADCAIEVDAARLMVWEAAWKLDQGQDAARRRRWRKQYADKAAVMVDRQRACRRWAVTGTSANTRSSAGCATRAASRPSMAWRWYSVNRFSESLTEQATGLVFVRSTANGYYKTLRVKPWQSVLRFPNGSSRACK